MLVQAISSSFHQTITLDGRGLVLGADTRLAVFAKMTGRLEADAERLEGLLAIAFGRLPSNRTLMAIGSAAAHWERGDKALANLRLAFAGLPPLNAPEDVCRLKAAELLFDAGLSANYLAAQLASDGADFGKYDPDQPRVPAGQGGNSGQWTSGIYSRVRAWLDEEVPEYDHDTGDVVGTRSRARAIATNPLTILGIGAAAIAAGEVLVPVAVVGEAAEASAAVSPVVGEAEALTPIAELEVSPSGIAANAARGAESEARVLQDMGLGRNTKSVATEEGRSVPDALTNSVSVEIKDAAYVSCTKQVRIQTGAAKASGREAILVTGTETKVSANAEEAYGRVIRRPDLGPR